MTLEISTEFVEKTKTVVKWKSADGAIFDNAVHCLCYQLLYQLETAINDIYSNQEDATLLSCFERLAEYFEKSAQDFFRSGKVESILDSVDSRYHSEDIDNWINSCKAHIKHTIEEIKELNAMEFSKNTGLVIRHWQCSDKPCYKVYRIRLLTGNTCHYMGVYFEAGGSPYPNQSYPGYYGNKLSLPDFSRYWEDTVSKCVPSSII